MWEKLVAWVIAHMPRRLRPHFTNFFTLTASGAAYSVIGKTANLTAGGGATLQPFQVQRTGTRYGSFLLAEAATVDGDTILVQPGIYPMTLNGWGTVKSITVKSAVPGQRYVIAMQRDMSVGGNGTIGNAFSVSGYYRQQAGLAGRQVVSLEDAEIYADGLTYITGKTAIWVDCRSGTRPVDFALRRCFIHDYDQGLETGNEYDYTDRTSTVTIEDSIIYQTGDIASGDNNHCIYVGFCGALTMKGSIVHTKAKPTWTGPNVVNFHIDGPSYWPVGHLVKCRAKALTIDGCRLTAEDTTPSNCVEYGNGGDLLMRGNIVEIGNWSDSFAMVSYGRFFTAQNPGGTLEIVSKDGRTNRIRLYQNTFVNNNTHDISGGREQFVELSYQTTQAEWTRLGLGTVPADMTLAANQDIRSNLWIDNSLNTAVLPSAGYPNVGTQPGGVLNVVGIACAHATDNTTLGSDTKAAMSALTDISNRYGGWVPLSPVTGSQNFAPFSLQDVAVSSYATLSPTSVARTDATIGASNAGGPTWYNSALLNGWTKLTFLPSWFGAIQDTVASAANPDDFSTYKAIWPGYGGYTPGVWPRTGVPLIAGKNPLPGNMIEIMHAEQGCCLAENAIVKRRGVTYTGSFLVFPAGGGHGEGVNNQILAAGPFESETPHFMDLTQPDTPPPQITDATLPNTAWAGPSNYSTSTSPIDGHPAFPNGSARPVSTHQYASIEYVPSRNMVMWIGGPAQSTGPTPAPVYAFKLDADTWDWSNDAAAFPARNVCYLLPAVAGSVGVNGIYGVTVIDAARDDVWFNSPYPSNGAPYIIHAPSTAQNSTFKFVELSIGNFSCLTEQGNYLNAATVGWALNRGAGDPAPGPWIAYVNECRPMQFEVLNVVYSPSNSGADQSFWELKKRRFWSLNVVPKDGIAINKIPDVVAGWGPGQQLAGVTDALRSSVAFDRANRCFYTVIFQYDATPRMDVYKIVPSSDDGMVIGIGTGSETVPNWTSEKITQATGSLIELPEPVFTNDGSTADGKGYFPQHKKLVVLPAPVHGLLFYHSTTSSPIFFKLP